VQKEKEGAVKKRRKRNLRCCLLREEGGMKEKKGWKLWVARRLERIGDCESNSRKGNGWTGSILGIGYGNAEGKEEVRSKESF